MTIQGISGHLDSFTQLKSSLDNMNLNEGFSYLRIVRILHKNPFFSSDRIYPLTSSKVVNIVTFIRPDLRRNFNRDPWVSRISFL